ncbi:MAG TPA: hypothetical protein VH540_21445 [Ktedonobacterales bacterium]|jgi:hypothetical protein
MADFFARLAQRALGQAPGVQPLIAPVFAPGPTLQGTRQEEATWSDVKTEAPGDHPRQSLSAQTLSRRASGRAPANSQAPVPGRLPSRSPAAQDEPQTEQHLARASLTISAPGEQAQSREHQSLEEPPPLHAAPPYAAGAPLLIRPQVSLYRQEHQQLEPLERTNNTAEVPTTSPTIRVTIGRIDVRAMLPPQNQPPRAAPARSGPALSLDEYLKRRERGER